MTCQHGWEKLQKAQPLNEEHLRKGESAFRYKYYKAWPKKKPHIQAELDRLSRVHRVHAATLKRKRLSAKVGLGG